MPITIEQRKELTGFYSFMRTETILSNFMRNRRCSEKSKGTYHRSRVELSRLNHGQTLIELVRFFFSFFLAFFSLGFDFRSSKMVVKRCSWEKCNSDSRCPDRYPCVKFIPFVKPKTQLEKCLRWIKACGRPHSQLNVEKTHDWTYICSRVSGSSTFCLKVEQP